MNIKDAYYKRIVYKKNAYDDLKTFIKFYHSGKNMLVLHSENSNNFDQLLTSIVESQNAYKTLYVSNFNIKTFNSLKDISKNYSLVIAFGNEEICNVAKCIAMSNSCEYILCPASFSLVNFSNHYYDINLKNIFKRCNYPTKIYIDETVIRTLDLITVGNGLKELVSIYDILFSFYIEKEIASFNFDINSLRKILERFDEIFLQVSQNNDDAKLVLMDNFIEIGFLLKNFSFNQFAYYNLANMMRKQNLFESSNFEDYLIIATDILLSIYEKAFEQKSFKQYYQPDYTEIVKIIEKYNFNIECYKKYEFYKNLLNNKELFMKINSIKVKVYLELQTFIRSFKEKLKNVSMFISIQNSIINYDKLFESLNVLPHIYQNNLLLDILAGVGMLSV